jgi:hypothetical protein
MLALAAGIVAFSADAETIRRRPIQQYTLLTLRWTFPARRASGGFNLLRGARRDASAGHLYKQAPMPARR